jgi:hypothetical protein
LASFKVDAYLEAKKALRHAGRQKTDQPEFWANLLGACANLLLASVPDHVVDAAVQEEDRRADERERVREHLKKRIRGKAVRTEP